VTTPAEELQQAMATAYRAWGSVAKAWIDGAEAVFEKVVEWAVDEDSVAGVNQRRFAVRTETGCEGLRAELHKLGDPPDVLLPPDAVAVDPDKLAPMGPKDSPAFIWVTIKPVAGVSKGPYVGRVVDKTGAVVEDGIEVVVIHTATD
jgi:hypothetical protein